MSLVAPGIIASISGDRIVLSTSPIERDVLNALLPLWQEASLLGAKLS